MMVTPDEFYAQRDSRTRRVCILESACEVPVLVRVGHDAARRPSVQLCVLTLINLLCRFHRSLVLDVPSVPTVIDARGARSDLLESACGKAPSVAHLPSPLLLEAASR